MSWHEIKTPIGKNESMGIMFPLRAPFVVLGQHEKVPETWEELTKEIAPTLTMKLVWGSVAYQRGKDGKTEKCAYWYDTSD